MQGTDEFAAVYDNPMASPTTKDVMLIDFNDDSHEYQSVKGIAEASYQYPQQNRAQKHPSPYDNPQELKMKHENQQPSNIGR